MRGLCRRHRHALDATATSLVTIRSLPPRPRPSKPTSPPSNSPPVPWTPTHAVKVSSLEAPLSRLLCVQCLPLHTLVFPPPIPGYLTPPRPLPPSPCIDHLLPNDRGTAVLPVFFCALRCIRCAARFRYYHRQSDFLQSAACALRVLLDAPFSVPGSTDMSASTGPSVGALIAQLAAVLAWIGRAPSCFVVATGRRGPGCKGQHDVIQRVLCTCKPGSRMSCLDCTLKRCIALSRCSLKLY